MQQRIALSQRDIDPETGKFKSREIPDPKNPKQKITVSGEEYAKMLIRAELEKNPDLKVIMIWHESAPGYGIPEELLNMEIPAIAENQKIYGQFITEVERIIHQFPGLKIQIGNSSASIGAVVVPMRAGANPAAYDYVGIETPSQVIPPEKLQECGLQGMQITQDVAEYYAKRNVDLNGCYEFVYRCERDIGEQQQAEWYMRDILICLAHDFQLISPGIFVDCRNGYYNGLWGGSGIIFRKPYIYPKRAYAAYAALTNVFDQVRFKRQIPTGSTTVYALEFERKDKKMASALWAARGSVDFEVSFKDNARVRVFDMYGREQTMSGKNITVRGGTAPVYLLTDKEIQAVNLKNRAFPKDDARGKVSKLVSAMDSMDLVEVKADPRAETTHTRFLPIMKPGNFTVKQVNDEQMGECLEVALDLSSDPYKSKYITEYTTIRLKDPVIVPGDPVGLGVWVKGNSSWGTIRFEIEDAKGEIFKNLSPFGWGCDVMDWQGNLSLNFDGWNMVSHHLVPSKIFLEKSPGAVSEQWASEGGDKKIDFPIKVRAVTVGINRHKLNLKDFEVSDPVIRIKNIVGLEE